MRLHRKSRGHEFWVKFDLSARVYEIFKSEDGSDYIGCADTISEVNKIVDDYLDHELQPRRMT